MASLFTCLYLIFICPLFSPSPDRPLASQRDPIADSPAVYICRPDAVSLSAIVNDLRARKYSCFFLCFSSALRRDQIEWLARESAISNCHSLILRVTDLHCEFVALSTLCTPGAASLTTVSLQHQLLLSTTPQASLTPKQLLQLSRCPPSTELDANAPARAASVQPYSFGGWLSSSASASLSELVRGPACSSLLLTNDPKVCDDFMMVC